MNDHARLDAKQPFQKCATTTPDDVVLSAMSDFLQKLHTYKTEEQANKSEAAIRVAFEEFLEKGDFLGTRMELDKLLEEIGGPKALREDGTISYFHQLGPIVNILALVECGELSLQQLEPYGGIEGMMRGHLRHDSVENYMPYQWYEAQQNEIVSAVTELRSNPARAQYEQCVANGAKKIVASLTKKEPMVKDGKLVYEDGKLVKIPLFATTEDYMHAMIPDGLAYALKLGDGGPNIATMLGADKFTPQKRLEYALDRWTMFGAEMGFSDKAMEASPELADTIEFFDKSMGAVLYMAVGYARYVDQLSIAGQPVYDGQSRIYESGIGSRYIFGVAHISVPPAFDIIVTKTSRIQKHANDPSVDPAERLRAQNFLNYAIYPALRPYAEYYPTLQIPANDEIADRYDLSDGQ